MTHAREVRPTAAEVAAQPATNIDLMRWKASIDILGIPLLTNSADIAVRESDVRKRQRMIANIERSIQSLFKQFNGDGEVAAAAASQTSPLPLHRKDTRKRK